LAPVDSDKVLPVYPFALFFDVDSADLTQGADQVLDNVVDTYRGIGAGHVALSGYASSATAGVDSGLSQRRLAAVRTFLVGKGVPESAISTETLTEEKPLIEATDGLHEPQNRRIEITVTPAAGPAPSR
jgi:outer membrane protein OmpA-like peptidoglycan-associated protein